MDIIQEIKQLYSDNIIAKETKQRAIKIAKQLKKNGIRAYLYEDFASGVSICVEDGDDYSLFEFMIDKNGDIAFAQEIDGKEDYRPNVTVTEVKEIIEEI